MTGDCSAVGNEPYDGSVVFGYIHAGWYGLGSSWIVIVLVAVALIRGFAMRNRRGAPPGNPPGRMPPGRTGTNSPPAGFGTGTMSSAVPSSATTKDPTAKEGASGVAAGWFPDPSGRYDQRYWSGTEWTEHVTKGGVPATDPPPNSGTRRSDEGA